MIVEKVAASPRACCFLNESTFRRYYDGSWLKAHLFLYDYFLFESERTLLGDANFLTYRNRDILEFILERSIYLEDLGMSLDREARNERAMEMTLARVVTRAGKFHKPFVRSFLRWANVMGGWKEICNLPLSLVTALPNESDALDEEAQCDPAFLGSHVIDELVDASISHQVLSSTGIPSVVDPLQSWLLRRIVAQEAAQDEAITSWHAVVASEVPDFGLMDWDWILKIRSLPRRSPFLAWLRDGEDKRSASDVAQRIQRGLWEIVQDAGGASVARTAVAGVLGNIPVPLPVNPFGLAQAAADTRRVSWREREYGWLFFLSDVKAMSRSARPDEISCLECGHPVKMGADACEQCGWSWLS
jgi:hypothetical protein